MTQAERKEYNRIYKLMHRGKSSDARLEFLLQPIKETYHEIEVFYDYNPDPVMCSVFGCGKTLSLLETRLGGVCLKHNEVK